MKNLVLLALFALAFLRCANDQPENTPNNQDRSAPPSVDSVRRDNTGEGSSPGTGSAEPADQRRPTRTLRDAGSMGHPEFVSSDTVYVETSTIKTDKPYQEPGGRGVNPAKSTVQTLIPPAPAKGLTSGNEANGNINSADIGRPSKKTKGSQ